MATVAAIGVYGVAGEKAAETALRPGSFRVAFIDALDAVSGGGRRRRACGRADMAIDVARLRLCLVTDRGLARGRSVVDVALAAARGGATMVQLREKDATTRAFLEEARALKAALAPLGVPLAINDRLDIALAVDADGLHVGQDDMPVERRGG